jgi:hypothetical protein
MASTGDPAVSIVLQPPAADPGITDDERRTIAEMMAKGTYAGILLATADLDGAFERLQASDAEVVQEPTEQPYGVRDCAVALRRRNATAPLVVPSHPSPTATAEHNAGERADRVDQRHRRPPPLAFANLRLRTTPQVDQRSGEQRQLDGASNDDPDRCRALSSSQRLAATDVTSRRSRRQLGALGPAAAGRSGFSHPRPSGPPAATSTENAGPPR